MKYKIFTIKNEKPIIFIGSDDAMKQYSSDTEGDESFNQWFIAHKKEFPKDAGFEDSTTGFSYYDLEEGDFNKDKEKVMKALKEVGYDAL
jgi:hypothetical protein